MSESNDHSFSLSTFKSSASKSSMSSVDCDLRVLSIKPSRYILRRRHLGQNVSALNTYPVISSNVFNKEHPFKGTGCRRWELWQCTYGPKRFESVNAHCLFSSAIRTYFCFIVDSRDCSRVSTRRQVARNISLAPRAHRSVHEGFLNAVGCAARERSCLRFLEAPRGLRRDFSILFGFICFSFVVELVIAYSSISVFCFFGNFSCAVNVWLRDGYMYGYG